ncbi:peptidase inhibitor family I36 protein [Streptomyces lavendofoliae]|uniref:peptidase inhibitor family I36 protein n=1 Tax=Streptomyces lavendofoliae TaxID=67314 RepID=UPI00300EF097
MAKIRTALLGAAMAATAILASPGIAQADGGCNAGEFCAYSDEHGQTYRTPNSSPNWPDTIQNKVDWVQNLGTSGSPAQVNIYYNENYASAYACLGQGAQWNLRQRTQVFSWTGQYSAGHMRVVHDDAASHKWVWTCGNNT